MEGHHEEKQEYPLGQQDFKALRDQNLVYVDKTMYIDKILRQRIQYLFLARPRRFGKSLFLSTLRYFFEGQRELFKGDEYDKPLVSAQLHAQKPYSPILDPDWYPYNHRQDST